MLTAVRRAACVVACVAVASSAGQAAFTLARRPARAAARTVPGLQGGRYLVRLGDTLSGIAAKLGVDVTALAAANGLANPHRIVAGTRLVVPSPAPAAPAAAPPSTLPDVLRQQPARLKLMATFDAVARDYHLPADLLKAVAWMESGWQNDKVSVANAYGIGQLMPDTVTFVNQQLLGVSLDPRRPEHNIRIAARYLRWLLDQTNGYVPTAVAGYYQGLASVRRIGMLADTRFYVASVLALQPRFR